MIGQLSTGDVAKGEDYERVEWRREYFLVTHSPGDTRVHGTKFAQAH